MSSLTIYFAGAKEINFEDINSENDYDPWTAYGQSKLANILFTRELNRRLKGMYIQELEHKRFLKFKTPNTITRSKVWENLL